MRSANEEGQAHGEFDFVRPTRTTFCVYERECPMGNQLRDG